MSMRMQKINSELRRQISDIVLREVEDPKVGLISITRVETTLDLQESKVYFSLLDDTKYAKVQGILNAMNKFIRVRLAKQIQLRILPQLRFIPDESIKYSVEINKKIEEIHQNDLARNKDDDK